MGRATITKDNARELGRKGGLHKRGKKHKRTIIKEVFEIDDIRELRTAVLKNCVKFLNDHNKKYSFAATRELLKYLFSPIHDQPKGTPGQINFIVHPDIAGHFNPSEFKKSE